MLSMLATVTEFSHPSIRSPHHSAPAWATVDALSERDASAAEALTTAMLGWNDTEIAAYRESVLAEIATLGDRSPTGFLAAELIALAALELDH